MKKDITTVKVSKDTQRKINVLAAFRSESQDKTLNRLASEEIVRVFGQELKPEDVRA